MQCTQTEVEIVNWWVFIKCEPKSSQLKEPKTNYFSLCALNLFNTRVSQFELNYWNKWTFPQYSNLLRCTLNILLIIIWYMLVYSDNMSDGTYFLLTLTVSIFHLPTFISTCNSLDKNSSTVWCLTLDNRNCRSSMEMSILTRSTKCFPASQPMLLLYSVQSSK